MRRLWNKYSKASPKTKISIISVLLLLNLLNFVGNDDSVTTKSPDNVEAESKFPKLSVPTNDGILEKIIKDFYFKNSSEEWWSRIERVQEGLLGDETAKMVYVKTNYRLDNVDDVENATLLCNALVSFLPREGLSVRVDGLIEKGRVLLDGTMETKVLEDPVTSWGRSWNPGQSPNWCVARTLFYSVRDGLQARGWKQQYGYGSLTAEEEKRMYEGAFMQEGKVYIVNK